MIQLIRNLFRKKRRRDLFYFSDGSKTRRIDPLIVVQLLEYHDDFTWEALDEALADSMESQLLIGRVVTEVFGVQSWNDKTGTGLTLAQRIDLMMQFNAYLIEVKKNIEPSPTSPSPSVATPNDLNEPTMSDTSVSI